MSGLPHIYLVEQAPSAVITGQPTAGIGELTYGSKQHSVNAEFWVYREECLEPLSLIVGVSVKGNPFFLLPR